MMWPVLDRTLRGGEPSLVLYQLEFSTLVLLLLLLVEVLHVEAEPVAEGLMEGK